MYNLSQKYQEIIHTKGRPQRYELTNLFCKFSLSLKYRTSFSFKFDITNEFSCAGSFKILIKTYGETILSKNTSILAIKSIIICSTKWLWICLVPVHLERF